jgi:LacI family transcriptional regulator
MNKTSTSSTLQRDIATRLGVSQATVSRALRDSPAISKALREKIQHLAKDIGYTPNAMAIGLVKQRQTSKANAITAELAWINTWPDPDRLRSFQEFAFYWKGASEAAEKSGYHLQEFATAKIPLPRIKKILEARNIHGVLIPPFWRAKPPEGWDRVEWEGFSCVRFGYSCDTPGFHVVAGAQLSNADMAVRKISQLGYHRIGYVTYDFGATAAWTRFHAGFLLAQNEIPLSPRIPVLYLPSPESNPEAQATLSDWLGKYRPDAILSDISYLRQMIETAGYRIPEDIGYASTSILDGDSNAGIDQNPEAIGRMAVQILISLLTHQERGIPDVRHETLVEGGWVDGSMMPPKNRGDR